jgi:hypothetical protein
MFRATIFVHYQVVLIQSLSTLSTIPPPLISVYNWGRSYYCLRCRFLVIDLNTIDCINLCPSVPKGIRYLQYRRRFILQKYLKIYKSALKFIFIIYEELKL